MKKSIKIISLLLACGMLMSMVSCTKKDKEPDAEEIQKEIDTVAEKLDELKSSDEYESLDPDEKTEKVVRELDGLTKKGLVKADTIFCDEENHIITYQYASGVLACEAIDEFDDNVCGMPSGPALSRQDEFYTANGEKKADALILWALSDQIENYPYCCDLAMEWSNAGVKTRIDSTVTLDDLCNLKDYEFVLFELHGIYLDFSCVKKELVSSIIITEQEPNKKTNEKYASDLQSYGVGILTGNRYFITSRFFENHYNKGDLSNSIFFFGSCQLMGKETIFCHDWDEALESASLIALVGFHNTVYTEYNVAIASAFTDSLMFFGGTTEAAFNYAIDLYGDSDVEYIREKNDYYKADHDVAFPILMGDYEATFPWETNVAPVGESTDPNSIDSNELYKEYLKNELSPQYRWNSMESFETYLDTSCGEGYAYNPIDSRIEAEGIISADVDDYNGDGVDDMIVVYMYKESAKDMDSVYTKEEHVFSPQTEIYRTRLAAFTIRGNNVVKTDEYDVMRYGYTKKQESIIGCLFPQEQDLKDLYIYKVLNGGSFSILFYSRVTSGPMFRFFNQSSWLMDLDSNGKFRLQSSYIYVGSGVNYTCKIYEFSDGVETSCWEYEESYDSTDTAPSINTYWDEYQIAYDDYDMTVIETDNQIRIGGYSTSIDYDENSSSYGYYYFADFFDSGNLSQTMR